MSNTAPKSFTKEDKEKKVLSENGEGDAEVTEVVKSKKNKKKKKKKAKEQLEEQTQNVSNHLREVDFTLHKMIKWKFVLL